jgi:hypothetical protein
VPRTDTTRALPLGIPNARFFADGNPKAMIEEGTLSPQREMSALTCAQPPASSRALYFLRR